MIPDRSTPASRLTGCSPSPCQLAAIDRTRTQRRRSAVPASQDRYDDLVTDRWGMTTPFVRKLAHKGQLLSGQSWMSRERGPFASPIWGAIMCRGSQLPLCGGTIHSLRTACPRAIHSPHQLSTRCGCRRRRAMHTVRAVSQTPTYDQLRGERINADVPPSEVDPPRLDQPGKHHPVDAPGLLAHGPSREVEANPATAWSWFESIEAGPSGKHHLWGEASGAAEQPDPSASPACRSRLRMSQAEKADLASATEREESLTPSPPGPPAALPPVAHARHTPSHGADNCSVPVSTVENLAQDKQASGRRAHPGRGLHPRSVDRPAMGYLMPKAVH